MASTPILVTSPDNKDAEYLNALHGGVGEKHVHHVTDDLAAFLTRVAGEQN